MQACVILALAILALAPVQQSITLEVRTFDGPTDVSEGTRVIVHRAGDREQPVGRVNIGSDRTVTVVPGIYDAQAIRERSANVVNIRWAERLMVMPYPDEKGHHLEVVNFQSGYGALEVRGTSGRAPEADVALFLPKDHSRPAAQSAITPLYALFVVRAGEYDVFVKRGTGDSWHPGVDVPLGRTRSGSYRSPVVRPSDMGDVGSAFRRKIIASQTTRLPLISRKTMTTSAMTSRM